MKRLVLLLVVLIFSCGAMADIYYWHNNGTGAEPTAWADPANWWNASAANSDTVPGAGDMAIVHSFGGGDPIISTDVGEVALLTPSWHDGVTSSVTLATGGYIYVSDTGTGLCLGMSAEGAGTAHGILNVTGGSGVAGILHVGVTGTGQVNLDAGWFHAGALAISAGSNIDIEDGALLYINGDKTVEVADWISSGLITAEDGTGRLACDFDITNPGLTTVYVVPYPVVTAVFSASFEDGEINPGREPALPTPGGTINVAAYPATQPEAFGQIDNYGWQNRINGTNALGDITIVDSNSLVGDNSAFVEDRVMRVDIELVLEADSIYTFAFWVQAQEGFNPIFDNRIVVKDQTNGHLFVSEENPKNIYCVPGEWMMRKVSIDTTGYAHTGELIDFRFGAVFNGEGGVFTDAWSLTYHSKDDDYQWQGDVDDKWSTAGNWNFNTIPGAGDAVIVDSNDIDWPMINSKVDDVDSITVGSVDEAEAKLVFELGGRMNITTLTLGAATDSFGVLWKNGGYLVVDDLSVGVLGGALVHVDGGLLEVGEVAFGSDGQIDVSRGEFVIDGDVTTDVAQWEADGWLTAYDGYGVLVYDYNTSNSGKTTIIATTLDYNKDDIVNMLDFSKFADHWLE